MKIDINKKYRYRMGHPVRILAIDADGAFQEGEPQPVIAWDARAGESTAHFEDGRFDSDWQNNPLDLIEVREPREWSVSEVTTEALENQASGRNPGDIVAYDEGDERMGYTIIRVREILD